MIRTLQILLISFLPFASISQEKVSDSLVRDLLEQKGDLAENTLSFLVEKRPFLKKYGKEERKDFLQTIEKEVEKIQSVLYPEVCFRIGQFFQEEGDYQTAYYFLYKTLKEEPNLYDDTKPYLAKFHEIMGLSYYYFKRYVNAELQLKQGLLSRFVREFDKINIYNTLALIQRDEKNFDIAEKYTKQAYQIAVKLNSEEWIGVLSGNLGFIAFERKNYNKASALIRKDYQISKKIGDLNSEVHALALLVEIDVVKEDLDSTLNKLDELKSLVEVDRKYPMLYAYYRVLTIYEEKIGDFRNALESFRLASIYTDSMIVSRNLLNTQNTEFQIDFERKQAEIEVLNERKKKDQFRIYGLIILSLVVITSATIFVRQSQRQRKRDKAKLLLEKEQVENDLRNAESEMRSILFKMGEKNGVIEQLKDEIEKIHSNQDSKTKVEKEKLLDNLQTFTLLTEDDWINFKRLFEKLNPEFFAFFHDNFPDISTAEIRLAALIKLNLSNQEMARTLGISPDSVRKTNLRLRKKLDIENVDDLTQYISKINQINFIQLSKTAS